MGYPKHIRDGKWQETKSKYSHQVYKSEPKRSNSICWDSLNKKTYSSLLNFSNYILSNVVPWSSNCSDQKLCTYISWPANPMIPTFRLYAKSLLLTYTTTYLLPHSNPLPSLLWIIAITTFLNILSAPNTQQSVLNWVARKVLLNISNISLLLMISTASHSIHCKSRETHHGGQCLCNLSTLSSTTTFLVSFIMLSYSIPATHWLPSSSANILIPSHLY